MLKRVKKKKESHVAEADLDEVHESVVAVLQEVDAELSQEESDV